MKDGTIAKLLDYYYSKNIFRNEVKKAMSEFYSIDLVSGEKFSAPEEEEGHFNEWFTFDFRLLNGKALVKDFCERNPLKFSQETLTVYRELQNNEFGLWKIIKVKKNIGLELKNIRSENKYFISEKLGTHGAKKGNYLIARVAKLGSNYELVGTHPQMIVGKSMNKMDKKFFINTKNLNPKVVRDYYNRKKKDLEKSIDKIKDRFLEDGKCICSFCNRKGKIGATLNNKETGELAIVCSACNIKMLAQRKGITKNQAIRERKKMFDTMYFFNEVKFKEYFADKNKKDFDSIDDANRVLGKVMEAWNNLSAEKRISFKKKNKNELEKIYKNIKVDFSGL